MTVDHYESAQKIIAEKGIPFLEVYDFLLIIGFAGTIGLIVAIIISILISRRRGWSLLNSVIVLVLAYVISWNNLIHWPTFIKQVFSAAGKVFNNPILEVITNGSILLMLGILCFFYNGLVKFIEGQNISKDLDLDCVG